MIIRKVVLPFLAILIALPAFAQERIKYHNPTGKEFPILAWFSVLGDENLTPERYKELRDAGFNISFSHFSNAESLEKGLKACRGTGVKIMVTCGELETQTTETVNRFKGDKSIAGWFLRDEPTTDGFDDLRKFRDRIYAADKKHLMYLNLLPSIVSAADLKAESYEDYVQKFVDKVNISQISYDFYPIVDDNYHIVVRPQFYDNLEMVRRVSLKSGYPFWAFCLSTAHNPYPIPNDTHLRVEAFSALAYGAQCIQYFTYWNPGTDVWNFHNAPIDERGEKTSVYYKVKRINREIHGLTKVFLGAKATDVSHTGENIPQGTKPLGEMPEKFQSIKSDGEGILVSQLVNGKNKYVMFVNRSIDFPQNVDFYLGEDVVRIFPCGKTQKLGVGKQTVKLTPGNYAIFKTK